MSSMRERDEPELAGAASSALAPSEAAMAFAPEAAPSLGALATARRNPSVAAVQALQRSVGNQAVSAMLSARRAPSPVTRGGSSVVRTPFSVSIPVGRMATEQVPGITAGTTPDSKYESHPTTPADIVIPEGPAAAATAVSPPAGATAPAPATPESASATTSAGPAAEPASTTAPGTDGGTGEAVVIQIPDVIKPELLMVQACDAIAGALNYAPTIENTATPGPSEFGICRFGDCKVTGITATLASGTYTVNGAIEHKITWGVHPTTDNETDISGDTDPDITKTNYPDVVHDLTPNMSSSGGRPPRNKFWAKDLTEIHEKFHADDVKSQAPGAVTLALNWLKTKTAASAGDVTGLVNQIPDRVVQTLAAGMGEPGEVRAYGAGAGAYTTRAGAIDKRGKNNEYK